MSLHTKSEKSINLPRKLDALAYLQKKRGIMTKKMRLRGKIFYTNCKVKEIYLQDCLETSDPKLAEDKLLDLKTLVRKGDYVGAIGVGVYDSENLAQTEPILDL